MPFVPPTLETARLILRIPGREDFEAWAVLGEDEQAMRHLGGVQSRFASWNRLMSAIGSWHVLGFGTFSVIRRSDRKWIGRVGPLRPEGWPGTEIGWTLAREAWGNGYATEAAIAATDWAFANLGWSEIIHCIAPDNLASQAVARRLGSVKRGPGKLPAPYSEDPIDLWAQTREQWLARRTLTSATT
ncbi:MAG: GNAT family N-acetyltransferase [Rhodanobacteraceae bacterium]